MGAGDRHAQKSFSVGMPGGDKWPFPKTTYRNDVSREEGGIECGECGKVVLPGVPHTDLRDEGRPKQRVCFGKVIAR